MTGAGRSSAASDRARSSPMSSMTTATRAYPPDSTGFPAKSSHGGGGGAGAVSGKRLKIQAKDPKEPEKAGNVRSARAGPAVEQIKAAKQRAELRRVMVRRIMALLKKREKGKSRLTKRRN